jgi:hypothetical protein
VPLGEPQEANDVSNTLQFGDTGEKNQKYFSEKSEVLEDLVVV